MTSDGYVSVPPQIVREVAEAASPGYLRRERFTSGERLGALTELSAEYSTTLETVLASLRSPNLDDRAARQQATAIAAEGLVHLRTASDHARTLDEEPVTTAFERLRDDLRPLMRFRDIDVQFIEPPVDGRPLPSEVAYGARAVVRGAILAMIDDATVSRVRTQWDCDGTNLLIGVRDDGDGSLTHRSSQLRLIEERVHALRGRISVDATEGWGTEMTIAVPLDPPQVRGSAPSGWSLGAREGEVLALLADGSRNRDIAEALSISENTVKFHVANVYRKLGVSNRSEATALYLSNA
ncbi:LuxR C-terminal-related transcriptional regulator [Microbacterium gubbeenense]|uniref:helix-turn-helix transcriptional regulator n=2 Tax=Microbacterium gubbeenense TaxID=159896 RepID=UPI003F99B436